MKTLSLLCLLTLGAAAVSAHAAEPAPSDCITLSQDQQLVRANASSNVLLRNGQAHYVVHFRGTCSSAAISPKLDFVTRGRDGELCSGGASTLRTSTDSCAVATLEPISAEQFAKKAKQRR